MNSTYLTLFLIILLFIILKKNKKHDYFSQTTKIEGNEKIKIIQGLTITLGNLENHRN